MAGSGYWRNRYTYQTAAVTVDAVGQASHAWSGALVVAGTITPSQREVLDDLGVTVRTDVVIESAFHPSVVAGGRLIEAGSALIYNISGVIDPDGGKKKRLRITATNMGAEAYVEPA